MFGNATSNQNISGFAAKELLGVHWTSISRRRGMLAGKHMVVGNRVRNIYLGRCYCVGVVVLRVVYIIGADVVSVSLFMFRNVSIYIADEQYIMFNKLYL